MVGGGQVSCTTLIAAQPTIFVTACREKRQSSDEMPSGSEMIHDRVQVRSARGGIVGHSSRQFSGSRLNWFSKLAGSRKYL